MTQATTAMVLNDVTLAYRQQPVLSRINAHIDHGTLTAVVGVNGCGKSTLLKAVAGLIKPLTGQITIAPNIHNMAYLAQVSEIDRSFPISVFDFVASGLWKKAGAFKAISAELETRILIALEAVGMRESADKLIGELSGGQFQRIRFAQLVLQEAQLFLLDEPFTGIDEPTMRDLMRLLHHWHRQGATLLVVLHDLELVRQQFPNVWLLGQQSILRQGDAATCLNTYAAAHPGTKNKTGIQEHA